MVDDDGVCDPNEQRRLKDEQDAGELPQGDGQGHRPAGPTAMLPQPQRGACHPERSVGANRRN